MHADPNPSVQTELAYVVARGGLLFPCPGGYRVENRIVRETGDYNAFFAHSYADLARLEAAADVRLFSIVVEEDARGRGHGREMLTREVAGSRVPVHLRAGEHLERFYAGAGFRVCHLSAEVLRQRGG